MNNIIVSNIIRIIIVLALQVLLLKQLDLSFGSFNYIHLFIYPILILFLPLKTPRILLLVVAFLIGIGLDFFYDSAGIHASANVFLAYCRKYVLKFLEPVEGYNVDQRLTVNRMGFAWVLSFVGILLFLHLFWYFNVEAFSFVYIKEVLLRTFSSFVASYVVIILFLVIYNPKN